MYHYTSQQTESYITACGKGDGKKNHYFGFRGQNTAKNTQDDNQSRAYVSFYLQLCKSFATETKFGVRCTKIIKHFYISFIMTFDQPLYASCYECSRLIIIIVLIFSPKKYKQKLNHVPVIHRTLTQFDCTTFCFLTRPSECYIKCI